MKNKLTDLNDYLFSQLDRLSDEEINGDELKQEIERAKVISSTAKEVINNAALQLKALELKVEYRGFKDGDMPALLEEPKA